MSTYTRSTAPDQLTVNDFLEDYFRYRDSPDDDPHDLQRRAHELGITVFPKPEATDEF